MEYFFTPPRQVTPPTLTVEGEELNHLAHVMRMRPGDVICAVDGAGTAYDAVIAEISRQAALCTITGRHPLLHEAEREVTVGAGILKNPSRFDFLVEKCVELGVRTIVPLQTERTIPRHARIDRWQKLCLAAMKQSGRSILPDVRQLTAFDDFLKSAPTGAITLMAHEKADHALRSSDLGGQGRAVVVCIGPEGGFSDAEVGLAIRSGFAAVTLGPRRLRTETAAIVALATVLEGDPGAQRRPATLS